MSETYPTDAVSLLTRGEAELMRHVAWAEAEGFYPYFLPVEGGDATEVVIRGVRKIMLGSNNYLGLTHHPRVVEAVRNALDRFGSGATGSRLLTGNTVLHDALEERFCDLFQKEAALVFTTGYQTNVGIISALVGRGDHVYLDRRAHASIVDGALMCLGTLHRYPHQDAGALDLMLREVDPDAGKLVVTDGVFSMEGDLTDLPELVAVARRGGAAILVDDAHGLGLFGDRGAGTASHFGVQDEVDLIMATFSKSLGSIGGVVAGEREVIDVLRHTARSLIFSAGLPPASVAGTLAALEVMTSEPGLRERLWHNSDRLREGLTELGLPVGESRTPILPVPMEGMETAFRFWKALYDRGVLVHPVVPPAVPPRSCLIRVSVTAAHRDEQIDRVLEAFAGALGAVEI